MKIVISALAIVVMSLSGTDLAAAQLTGQGDHLVFANIDQLHELALPRGPGGSSTPLSDGVDILAFSPAGQLIAVRQNDDSLATELARVSESGEVTTIGVIPFDSNDTPRDLAFDRDGRLYLLTSWFFWNPPESGTRLMELDVATGAILDVKELEREILAMAPAPQGLWAVANHALYRLYPSTGMLVETEGSLESLLPISRSPFAADADSTGALWLLTHVPTVSPPIYELWRLDPESGAVTSSLYSFNGPFAIRRQCQEGATARCLLGGRFRAEVQWVDIDVVREGYPTASRSADSSLFWFFSPANWELLVKVLDGCEENGHFWVFTAAATDIVYAVEITDLESGMKQVYRHGGGPATAVTDNQAFATCP